MRQSEEHLSWKSELGEEKKETSSAWGTDYNLLYNTFASYLSPLHVHWVQTWGGIMYIQIQTWATKCWPASIFMQLCIPVTNFSRLLWDLQPSTSMWPSTFKLMHENLQGGISKPPIFTVLLDYLTRWTLAWMASRWTADLIMSSLQILTSSSPQSSFRWHTLNCCILTLQMVEFSDTRRD